MAAARVTFQDLLSAGGDPNNYLVFGSDLIVPLDCREATLYVTYINSGSPPVINGISADRYITSSFQETAIGTLTYYISCRVDFPPKFDQDGLPVNYNDIITISNVDGLLAPGLVQGAVAVLKRVYFDPDIPDPNQPRQR